MAYLSGTFRWWHSLSEIGSVLSSPVPNRTGLKWFSSEPDRTKPSIRFWSLTRLLEPSGWQQKPKWTCIASVNEEVQASPMECSGRNLWCQGNWWCGRLAQSILRTALRSCRTQPFESSAIHCKKWWRVSDTRDLRETLWCYPCRCIRLGQVSIGFEDGVVLTVEKVSRNWDQAFCRHHFQFSNICKSKNLWFEHWIGCRGVMECKIFKMFEAGDWQKATCWQNSHQILHLSNFYLHQHPSCSHRRANRNRNCNF